ncbi:hypothetical protein [Inconstantimicrobium mannanitabidum]|uniref:Uncharacterized protein n=1 Tax=Inconstantimicrobium mannanitabidum TaxID=1604901 RepID=A0ACB5RA04_9CLOT|nr:hypothetical protein [Clostridium sp. TW13]GKX65870.1 hypothetical protein rsdtw13_11280 [Clostridium sp. TW13]
MELRLISDDGESEVKLIKKITTDELFKKAFAADITKEEEKRTNVIINRLGVHRSVQDKNRLYLVLNLIRLGKNYDNSLGRRISKEEYWENDISESIGNVFMKIDALNENIEIYEKKDMNYYNSEFCEECEGF